MDILDHHLDSAVQYLLLLGIIALLAWLVIPRILAWRRLKRAVGEERAQMLDRHIPPSIHHDMARAAAGDFDGEELTPLSYLGYHVGKTNGLPFLARRERLTVCFAIELPPILPVKYRKWGRPVTHQRYASLFNHLLMLANQRRGRASYRYAVSDWEDDLKWLAGEFGEVANKLAKYGFRR